MARLIDADKLIDFIDVGHLRHSGELCYSETDVANLLLHAPTVDAVPVVRCKDCKYFKTQLCENEDNYDDWFCADGERKDEVSE